MMMNEDGADDDDQKMMNPMKMTKTTLEAVYSTDQGKHQPVSKIKSNQIQKRASPAGRISDTDQHQAVVVVS